MIEPTTTSQPTHPTKSPISRGPREAESEEPKPWPLIGRSRGFWRLTDAADYNRYGHDLFPGWAQALLAAGGLGLACLFVWRASQSSGDDGLWRVLAYMLPVILIAIVLLIRAGAPDDPD